MEESETTLEEAEEEFMNFSDFLEGQPPNQEVRITNIWQWYEGNSPNYMALAAPQIQLHCSSESCNGTRFFRCISSPTKLKRGDFIDVYLIYRCWNCQTTEKTFSISIQQDDDGSYPPKDFKTGYAIKYGEKPAFGPTTSSRLIKLIGPDRDAFLKGRQCENQGLGIGAFVYYRRVVENQKSRILKEIAKVATKIGADPEQIKIFEEAQKEVQFTKAMSIAKPALPESLLISGHNPLGLLHSALSEGVHALSDHECLELAGSVRVVLNELSDRIAQALKDEANLKAALGTLINRKQKS